MAAKKAETVRKITIKEVFGDKAAVRAAVEKAKNGQAHLFTVIGVVNGAKPGSTQLGDYCKLVGDFEAVNLATGEVKQSSACILPNFLGDPIAAAVQRPNAESVQFAITIGAKADPKSLTGYTYTGESVLPPSDHSPIAMLRKQLEEQKLLPAPK